MLYCFLKQFFDLIIYCTYGEIIQDSHDISNLSDIGYELSSWKRGLLGLSKVGGGACKQGF